MFQVLAYEVLTDTELELLASDANDQSGVHLPTSVWHKVYLFRREHYRQRGVEPESCDINRGKKFNIIGAKVNRQLQVICKEKVR